jgi:hypothetical protein
VVTGSTPGSNLRNTLAGTQTQSGIVRRGAYDWSRRANWATYRPENFQQDLINMQVQFQGLREQFNGFAAVVQSLGRPAAYNAIAELDAGLNVIAELFPFLQNQFNSGTLDRQTIVRTCRALESAVREWEAELRRSTSRMGMVF